MRTTTSTTRPAPAGIDPAASRTLLVSLYQELSAEIEQASAVVRTWVDGTGEAGEDEVDAGSRAAHREEDAAVLEAISRRRRQVERGIARIDAGGYGWCERCDAAIPAARLEAFPSATRCVGCC
jgi:DnaK suppressor protein